MQSLLLRLQSDVSAHRSDPGDCYNLGELHGGKTLFKGHTPSHFSILPLPFVL